MFVLWYYLFQPWKFSYCCNSSSCWSCRWFTEWQKYVGQGVGAFLFDEISTESQLLVSSKTANRPGPIDNTSLVSTGSDCEGDDLQLLRTMEEGQDYVLVCQEVWKKLFEWYINTRTHTHVIWLLRETEQCFTSLGIWLRILSYIAAECYFPII